MADQHDSSGSGGELAESQDGSGASDGTQEIYRDFKPVGTPWVDSCPKCTSTDIRRCVAIMQDFAWCGACGARDGQ